MAILGASSGALAISKCSCAKDCVLKTGLSAVKIARQSKCLRVVSIIRYFLKST